MGGGRGEGLGAVKDCPHPTGRSIGLCNGKLNAMSGEEVESAEQGELDERVRKVGSSQVQRSQGVGSGVSTSAFTDGRLFPVSVSRCLSSSGPAQSTNSKS